MSEYEYLAQGSPRVAQRRPLTKEEFDRMQQYLACMRMICDTPAILDPECRVCPKLEELEGVLCELLEDPDRARSIDVLRMGTMLTLVRELAGEMGVELRLAHRHRCRSERRRAEIARFK